MKCKFCYATFNAFKVERQLSRDEAFTILQKLKDAGLQKITFAGGEPMLYKHLDDCIYYAKKIGLTTSIITNGSLITTAWLIKMKGLLDWVGISIDSLNHQTNEKIGRISKQTPDYAELISSIKIMGYKLKINTVVNSYNHFEDMNEFLNWAQPNRWKVFQALRVENQNNDSFDEMKITNEQFESFITRHKLQPNIVPENNEHMTASYLLIDPLGRLYENNTSNNTYSRSLLNHSIEKCLSDIDLNRKMFIKRGGIYQW